MGYFKHGLTCVVVHDFEKSLIRELDAWSEKAKGRRCGTASPVIVKVGIPLNGFVAYIIPPDGSKEGWAESDKVDELRQELVAFAPRNAVDVFFGGDDPEDREFANEVPEHTEADEEADLVRFLADHPQEPPKPKPEPPPPGSDLWSKHR